MGYISTKDVSKDFVKMGSTLHTLKLYISYDIGSGGQKGWGLERSTPKTDSSFPGYKRICIYFLYLCCLPFPNLIQRPCAIFRIYVYFLKATNHENSKLKMFKRIYMHVFSSQVRNKVSHKKDFGPNSSQHQLPGTLWTVFKNSVKVKMP